MIREILDRLENPREEDAKRVGRAVARMLIVAFGALCSGALAAAIFASIMHLFDHRVGWCWYFLWILPMSLAIATFKAIAKHRSAKADSA